MRTPLSTIRDFLKLEASGGILLVGVAALALIAANSPLAALYDHLLDIPIVVQIGSFMLAKPLLLWINDGLMAVFFLLVGLEIKREVLQGELSSWAKASLPAIAAIGGMAAPAAIYALVNADSPATLDGWAIPVATDIAFAMGVLSLLGSRIPTALKVFLLALAIIDDLGAIVIIALFYTADLSLPSLLLALAGIAVLAALNLRGVARLAPYLLVGAFIWVCVLKSGVHATLAGVAVACFIPLKSRQEAVPAPLQHLEHMLHPWVSFAILPIFAFANAGVSFAGVSPEALAAPLPLGITLGLFLGKETGVFLTSWLAAKARLCRLPEGIDWISFYGVSLLTGIGFTMSLFIGSLAFGDAAHATSIRLGVFSGSLLSAISGYLLLRATSRRR